MLDSDWLDGGEGEGVPGPKGFIVTKQKLAQILDIAPKTLDKLFAAGTPVEERGSKRAGWKIRVGRFEDWRIRHTVALATADPDAAGFDAAKTREKEATARL